VGFELGTRLSRSSSVSRGVIWRRDGDLAEVGGIVLGRDLEACSLRDLELLLRLP
jgi:hypothetical protein